jgi:hypothetical protein
MLKSMQYVHNEMSEGCLRAVRVKEIAEQKDEASAPGALGELPEARKEAGSLACGRWL